MIIIKYNHDEEMMMIHNDDLYSNECIFHGNYWDFAQDPEWIREFLEKAGLCVKIKKCKKSLCE